jgi:hypothetical protein
LIDVAVTVDEQFCRECDIDIYGPNGPCGDPDIPGFVTYEDALNSARKLRDENEWFTDHTYTNSDNAPFDSSTRNNYDSDEAVLIQVMTKTDFCIKMARQMKMMYGNGVTRPNE